MEPIKENTMNKKVDFYFKDEISLIILIPKSETAKQWVTDNLHLKHWQGEGNIAIEPRYFPDILEGIKADGLTVKLFK